MDVSVTGLQEALKKLEGLKRAIAGKILRSAIGKANAVVKKEIKLRIPKRTGRLRKSIGVKIQLYAASFTAVGIVGPAKDKQVASYSNPVEAGRRATTSKRTVKLKSGGTKVYTVTVSATTAKRYMANARTASVSEVLTVMTDRIVQGIQDATK